MFKSRYDYSATVITPRSAGLPQTISFSTTNRICFFWRSIVAGWHIAMSGLWGAAH
jgi:hypothetical protein